MPKNVSMEIKFVFYNIWLSEQETFQDLIAKNEKIEFEKNKLAKNNNLNLKQEIYKEE